MIAIGRPMAGRLVALLCLVALCWGCNTSNILAASADFADASMAGGKANLTLTTSFAAATEDIGRPLRVYMLAIIPTSGGNAVYARTAQAWVQLAAQTVPELIATVGTTSHQSLPIVADLDVRSLAGTVVYLGYGLDDTTAATPFDEMMRAEPVRIFVCEA